MNMPSLERRRFIIYNSILALAWASSAVAATPVENGKMTVYRCTDGKGKVSLQDNPCLAASKQETLLMTRPKDAPAVIPAKPPVAPSAIAIGSSVQAQEAWIPPPELYRCTDFDGKVREAEYYDPKPRCVPLWVLGYESRSQACRWVEDSCVRYQGKELCERWEAKRKQTELDVSHSDSSGAPYLKSELARFTQIVNTSCRR
jgi:Domain of unknown function (DUF4124)